MPTFLSPENGAMEQKYARQFHSCSPRGFNVDKQHKLIRRYTVTDAAVHDSQVLEAVLQPKTAGRDVWDDAAYRSDEIETQLKTRNLRSRIQYKGYRDKPLTLQQQQTNQRRARIRVRVEHVFGHHVTAMGGKLI